MAKLIRFAPVIVLVLYLVAKAIPHIPKPLPSPKEYEPTASQKILLHPVQESLAGHPDAAKDFTNLYLGIALVVGADEVILKTTGDVRSAHENAGALAVQAGELPRIPGFAKAVNEYLSAEIGRDNVPLDLEKRLKIVDAFKGLAWATSQ